MESTPLKSPLSSKGMRTPEKQGDAAAEDPEELARIIKLRETYAYFKQIQDEMELERLGFRTTRSAARAWRHSLREGFARRLDGVSLGRADAT